MKFPLIASLFLALGLGSQVMLAADIALLLVILIAIGTLTGAAFGLPSLAASFKRWRYSQKLKFKQLRNVDVEAAIEQVEDDQSHAELLKDLKEALRRLEEQEGSDE